MRGCGTSADTPGDGFAARVFSPVTGDMRSKTILPLHRATARAVRQRRRAARSAPSPVPPVLVGLWSVPALFPWGADAYAARILAASRVTCGDLPLVVPGGVAIATGLFGEGSVRFVPPSRLHGQTSRSLNDRGWKVELRDDLPREHWSLEVAYHVAAILYDEEFGERPHHARNAVGRALIMPRRSLLRALNRHGSDLRSLATIFETTEGAVLERIRDIAARGWAPVLNHLRGA
jgi:hypothetical protein